VRAILLDEAQLAAVAFLARYGGRTLESYRADLRQFFQWTARVGLAPLAATRAHIELYRAWMEDRGLAASTVDRRLSTLCGYYRFAHLDGRIRANPALHVRRPPVHPSAQRGMDRGELAAFLYAAERISPAHAALAVILVRHDGARLDARTAYRWVRATGRHAGLDHVHPHMLRAAFIMAVLDAGVPLRDVQLAARHVDPRTTTVYDRRRQNLDRHAAYAVVAFVTSG
jgi:site-specific recombinase XerD